MVFKTFVLFTSQNYECHQATLQLKKNKNKKRCWGKVLV